MKWGIFGFRKREVDYGVRERLTSIISQKRGTYLYGKNKVGHGFMHPSIGISF